MINHSDAADSTEGAGGSGFRRAVGRIIAPTVISAARIATRLTTRGVQITWFDDWNATLDEALDALPAIPGCDRDLYRELTQPTSILKRHALATENGQPTALISLRRRKAFWEPVAYQALPGVIAPASSPAALGRALNALGVEVRIEAGLDKNVVDLNPRSHWAPDSYHIDLLGDYEAHWSSNHRYNVRRARKKCDAFMRIRIDEMSDLDWCCAQWCRMWKSADTGETVATEDRLRFWRAFMKQQNADSAIQFHILSLLDGDRRTASRVVMCKDGIALAQCITRDSEYDRFSVGVRIMDASIKWAAKAGYRRFDLGSGGTYKQSWGQHVSGRYGAIFRPRMISALYRFGLI